MAKSIKLQNNNYWDSSGITHNKKKLNEILNDVNYYKLLSVNATGGTNKTLTASTRTNFGLTTLENNTGGFELTSDGRVKCLYSGLLLATASAFFSPRKGYCGVVILKNNSWVADSYAPAGTQTYGVVETANRLIPVTAGQIIGLAVQSGTANDIARADARTRLTLTYVKVDK